MDEPHLKKPTTIGELLDLVEAQVTNAATVITYVSGRGTPYSGSLLPVAEAHLDSLRFNLGALRGALSEHDALNHPLGELLSHFAWERKFGNEALAEIAERATRILEKAPDTPPEEEAD